MENFDYDYLLGGFAIIAEAIDRANALKALELTAEHGGRFDDTVHEFLSKCVSQAVRQYQEESEGNDDE